MPKKDKQKIVWTTEDEFALIDGLGAGATGGGRLHSLLQYKQALACSGRQPNPTVRWMTRVERGKVKIGVHDYLAQAIEREQRKQVVNKVGAGDARTAMNVSTYGRPE